MPSVRVSLIGPAVALLILAGLVAGGAPQTSAHAQTIGPAQPIGLTAFHRSGQTFLTWNERTDPSAGSGQALSGERYHLYRHTSPITAANLAQATRLTEAWGALGEGSSIFWSDRAREPPITPNYVIQDLGAPLSDTTGFFAWMTNENGTFYYAVTTVQGGTENITDLGPGNTAGPIAEVVADPQPVKVWQAAGDRGFVFTQYLDYSRYNPTFGVPQGSAAQQYAFNYGVTLPSDAACGGSLPDSLPANVYLEGWGGRYSNDTVTPYDWCAVNIVPDDPNQTWYYGHSASYDYRLGGTADTGPIVNFTEERILRAVFDTLRDPTFRLDPNRIYVTGHSMGGSGALALGMRYPNVFAASYSSEPMTNYQAADGSGGSVNWLNDTEPNYGLLLEPDNGPWLHHQFRSSEYTDPAVRPRLVTQFRPACPADVTGDGVVDVVDVQTVAAWWNRDDFPPETDVNDDGVVDIGDIMAVVAQWEQSCALVTPTATSTATLTATATPTATATITATATPGGGVVANFCPPYVDSPLYRSRLSQITVGPSDDWMGTIEAAVPGTEILLLDGEYLLDRYAVVVDDGITIRGAGGDRDAVLIRGQGYGVGSEGFMVFGANVTIADLSMTGMRNHAISIKGEQGAQAPHIYNVHLYDIGTQHIKGTPGGIADGVVACSSIGYTPGGVQGDYIDGVDIHQAIDWVIRDNLFYNIWGDGSGCEVDIDCGTYVSGPAILMWNQARGTIVERNVFRDCFRNIAFGLGRGHQGGIIRNNFIYQLSPGDAGIELRDADNARVEHNTIILGGDYPGAIEVWNAGGHLIRNNLITAPIWDRGNASFVAEGNITDASVEDLVAPGDPHLPAGSRAIGAGVPTDVDSDIHGDPREGRWDVGADQVSQ
ncbi:MAG: alpha/beta hydrolase-fold protein [Anaerolineae bacterium]